MKCPHCNEELEVSFYGDNKLSLIEDKTARIWDIAERLAETIRKIHIENEFPKVKIFGSEKMGCMFCKFKGGVHPLCNSKYNQYAELLKEHKRFDG